MTTPYGKKPPLFHAVKAQIRPICLESALLLELIVVRSVRDDPWGI
jgi:hypothetical protein